MTQGDFIEKVLTRALSEPDIRAYVKRLSQNDLRGLLEYVEDKQGGFIAEGLLRDRNGNLYNTNWEADFERLSIVANLVRARLPKAEQMPGVIEIQEERTPDTRPSKISCLNEKGLEKFRETIEIGLIAPNDQERWKASRFALALWIDDLHLAGCILNREKYSPLDKTTGRRIIKPFELYFDKKHIAAEYYYLEDKELPESYREKRGILFPELKEKK